MLTRWIRSITAPRPILSALGGAALAVGIVLATEARASALTLPFSFSNTTFTTTSGSGTLSGQFSLNCGAQTDATQCVTEPFGSNLDGNTGTFRPLTISSISPVTYTLTSPAETVVFQTGVYGFNTQANSYFLSFSFDGPGGGGDRNILIWLTGTLPTEGGGTIPVTASVTNNNMTFNSEICTNVLPPSAANACPPGKRETITGFQGQVINLVPSPFSITLLIPAAALVKLRRRYQPKG
ncbi:hypothetical protein [Cyanobium sp. CH-040]|uniref:hypothetical protein n=1 Tax=Cyanobium sp. CH-040 TaxID=2823708 RepID=UPI0020CDC1CD|nr:hypothetical protein [Cyanobium sp. CH-040]MCP9927880.1 hypothetical protein [Cyanobium sp. CH-040]